MSWPRAVAVALPMLLLAAAEARPHHAFSPVYDDKRVISVTGVVTEFRFVNPHAMMFMDVTNDTGKLVQWTVEFAGRLNLSEFGWTADSIEAGERVTVTGNPTHTGSARMFFRKILRADGTELLPGNAQRLDTIEEQRRRRRQNSQQP
ncbi:MAG: hypothetical protein HYY76_15865 [Acidobacteria bacterium]|nr:hypothetical protein [Acidobacteriota bacterium]